MHFYLLRSPWGSIFYAFSYGIRIARVHQAPYCTGVDTSSWVDTTSCKVFTDSKAASKKSPSQPGNQLFGQSVNQIISQPANQLTSYSVTQLTS